VCSYDVIGTQCYDYRAFFAFTVQRFVDEFLVARRAMGDLLVMKSPFLGGIFLARLSSVDKLRMSAFGRFCCKVFLG
jgi:hypothetical protein